MYLYKGPHSLIYNLKSQKFQELKDFSLEFI